MIVDLSQDAAASHYAFKREFWKMQIDGDVDEREAQILDQQAKGRRPSDNCSARREAWRELLNEASHDLWNATAHTGEWFDAQTRVSLLLAWGELP